MSNQRRKPLTEKEFFAAYDPARYERPSVAADMAVFTVTDAEEPNYRKLPEKELRLLLVRRGEHPFRGQWALPGGFVRPDETVEETARRELLEETGIGTAYMEQLLTFSDPARDPRMRVISCSYLALMDAQGLRPRGGDDASAAEWMRVGCRPVEERTETGGDRHTCIRRIALTLTGRETALAAVVEHTVHREAGGRREEYTILENDGLAFDHAKIIAAAVQRLRTGLEHSDIALHLMPPLFTLSALQQVYEVIGGKPLLAAAFRRKAAPLVRETDGYTGDAGHRPSRLYRRYWELD